ncbi:putative retrotransposon gag domain-containing protein [Helianthus annuus]|nr:putative retrotransposon gag domain-containing protein [Helianthus annuus]
MPGSDEVNSHPRENHDTSRVNVAGAELQALIDNAVTQALDRQFNESSGTHVRTQSIPHSKPPSRTHTAHKSDSHPYKRVVLNQEPRDKGCTYKYFVSCKPRDFTWEKGANDCMTWLDEMDTVVDISGCADKNVVKFVSQSFKGEALAWWRSLIQATGKIPLYNLSWDQFVTLIKENYCPQHEVENIEADFLSLV